MRRRQINVARALAAGAAAVAVAEANPSRPELSIAALRERKGLSVDDLAAELGMKPGALALIERTEAARLRIRKHLNGE